MGTTTSPAQQTDAGALQPRGDRGVLVVLAGGGLGGFLAGIPAYRALAWAYPRYRRVLLCDEGVLPLVPYVGAFEDAVAEPFGCLSRSLHRPAIAVNLHGRGPWSHRFLLALRPGRLIAFAHPSVPESRHGATWRPHESDRIRWCRLLAAYGIAVDADDVELIPPARPVPPFVRGATVVHPGATRLSERLPAAQWAAVVRAERVAGRSVIVTGGPDEVTLANQVAAGASLMPERVFAGRVSTLDLAALVAAADNVVTSDAGVGQLAVALHKPWQRPHATAARDAAAVAPAV